MEKLLKTFNSGLSGTHGPGLSRIFIFIIAFLGLSISLISPQKASAQINSLGISTYLPITDSKIEDGDIIIVSEKGYSLSTISYDARMIGVVSLNPAIELKTAGQKNGLPVINSGVAYVKVTGTAEKPIKKGDFITSSTLRGAGMKAETSGFVLGSALDDAKFTKDKDVKLIQVSVDPHFVQSGLQTNSILDIFNIGKLAAAEKPAKVLQYIVAAIITIVTFGAGFFIFAKTVNTGLEALGRNPLAGRMIQLSIVFNVILIIVIIVAGTGLAYLVIRL